MAARSKARKRALDVLFGSEVGRQDAMVELELTAATSEHPLNPYTRQIVEGVVAHRERIDELIETYAVGWTLDRMPAVDRNVLRIGVWELLWADDVPDVVAISEAVGMATDLSTDDSGPFVNGLLARIVEVKPRLAQE
ncbi:MAG: transcription antitermination factor NusB [Actinobacteria bacterium]|nr:MAG: transcription antitermination factor NusB [Actinomycetota bacterium]